MHGPSKIAGETRFVLDLRSLSEATMDSVAAEARGAAARISSAYRVHIDLGATSDSPPAVMDPGLRSRLMSLLDRPFEMASGAGHDAAIFAKVGIPSAMDRKSTRLNSSHRCISYAVFCLKKKNRN